MTSPKKPKPITTEPEPTTTEFPTDPVSDLEHDLRLAELAELDLGPGDFCPDFVYECEECGAPWACGCRR